MDALKQMILFFSERKRKEVILHQFYAIMTFVVFRMNIYARFFVCCNMFSIEEVQVNLNGRVTM